MCGRMQACELFAPQKRTQEGRHRTKGGPRLDLRSACVTPEIWQCASYVNDWSERGRLVDYLRDRQQRLRRFELLGLAQPFGGFLRFHGCFLLDRIARQKRG